MKKRLILMTVLLLSLTLSACQSKTYDIVVTLFPQYDMVRTIVGEKDLTYTMLLSPGVEAHGFEPTSKQMGLIQSSKLFIYTSDELETWANDIENQGQYINLEALTEAFHEDAHEGTDEHVHEDEHDVHYWVSVHAQVHMVEAILSLIVELDPENQAYYEANANQMINDLKDVKDKLLVLSAYSSIKPIYFIGHNVFSSLNEEFGLYITSLTEAFSPESDPTSAQIGQMIDEIKSYQASYIYYDPFENDAIAKTIQTDLESSGYTVAMLALHSMHNMSKSQFDQGYTLLDLWMENLENIKLTYGIEG